MNKISKDAFYSLCAMIVYNGILQLIIYPIINKSIGVEAFGHFIYIISFLSVFSVPIGTSIGNEQLINNNYEKNSQHFFSKILICISFIFIPIILVILFLTGENWQSLIFISVLFLLTTFRYYADVFFKIRKLFFNYLLYYVFLSVGYCVVLFLVQKSKNPYFYFLIFIIGELTAVCYSLIYNKKFIFIKKKSDYNPNEKKIKKQIVILILSYIVYNASLNFDRIIVNYILGEEAVSHYYVASLIGKTIAILIGPINTLIYTYGDKIKNKLSMKNYFKIVGIVLVIGAVIFLLTCLISPVFINIFYKSLYNEVSGYIVLVSLGQILLFSSSILLSILLLFSDSKWQFYIQTLYAVIFLVLIILFTFKFGLKGTAISTILAGVFKICFVVLVSLHVLKIKKMI